MQAMQKVAMILVSIAVALMIVVLVNSNYTIKTSSENYRESSDANIEIFPRSEEQASETPTSIREAGSIETRDGKDFFIRLSGEGSNNFGELPFRKGESFTLSVSSEEVRSLEIGLKSISTEKVYKELVREGTGSVVISIPEDGKYRVYIKNKSSDTAEFKMILSKAIEGPIV
ncbi:hypothetical protein ACK8P5_08905 [Paenibacillus sp. EC2-1]|uniref:hypothetical protein n=1 Tax=Paenibacillus sp. EC2-1 TaxID=3388665 RepID=UPI003BEF331C